MLKYILLILMLNFSNGFAASSINAIDQTDLIIDTDMGIDDSMAITYILLHKSIHIPFISIVADSNSSCKYATENLARIINTFANYSIPIACGPSKPLVGNNSFPKSIIDDMDKHAGYNLPYVKVQIKYDAVEQLYRTLINESRPVNILSLAPQTNLALLFDTHSDVIKKVKHIYSMGGALKVLGNINAFDSRGIYKYSEWNIYIDPVAYKDVLKTLIPITIIPLDITRLAIFDTKIYNKLGQHLNIPASKFVYGILNVEYKFLISKKWEFWDPMAAVIMLHPELANCQTDKINIISNSNSHDNGRMIYDRKNGYPSIICYSLTSKEDFENEFTSVITH
ncbi:MAG: nucleoside hydrolase [Burkholderiales bacterium]|nr:nucleoside hydrolase [Burkholderiales bacterium]